MRSLFRSVFLETEADAPSASNHENTKTVASDVPEPLASDGPEVSTRNLSEASTGEVPDGLISASDLPSAAHVLADLFPESEAEASSRDGDGIAALVGANDTPTDATEALADASDVDTDLPPNIIEEPAAEQPGAGQHEAVAVHQGNDSLESDHAQSADDDISPAEMIALADTPASSDVSAGAKVDANAGPSADATVLDLSELIDREVAAAGSAQSAHLTQSGSAVEFAAESVNAIPLDPSFLSSELPRETETEILSIDLAKRAVDAATKDNVSPLPVSAGSAADSDEPAAGPAPVIHLASSDWALEERLACHKEWVESHGISGSKANLACAKLENAELIGVNLRHADLQDSNLKGADLLLADLRDACLVRANLQEACLVGANLEGANLERATLDTSMGLVPRQLAGANLHGASLPAQLSEFDAQAGFARASQMAARFFTATMAISAFSTLLIWQTKDLQLLANSAILRFLHSQAAAAALPTAQLYLIAPVVLFIVYAVFHFHLQTLWDAVLQLPAVFPDGRELGQNQPRIVRGLLRAHFRWMNRDALSTQAIERSAALLLAYWVAPLTLLLFWARYLTLQNLHGTILHLLLVVTASGVALYSTTKVGRSQERWSTEGKRTWRWLAKVSDVNPLKVAAGFGVLLLFLAAGTIKGVPHDKSRAPQFSAASLRRWAPTIFWSLGYDPYADLTEASLSRPPAKWSGSDDQISSVTGAKLSNTKFRYAQAYGVFLVNAHLWRSNFQGAFLSDADLRGADLGQATLRYAIMDRARLYHANLDRGSLDDANLNRADFRESNLSYCSIEDAILIDAQFQGATIYGARLNGSSMERANLEKSDLRSAHLDNANLDHADLQQAYLWSAKLPGAILRNAQLNSAIFIDADLQNTDLRGAQLSGTVLNGTNLAGAIIDGTDLRGALGLTPAQVCSTKSRNGAILTDSLGAQVQATCGGPLLAAPAPVLATPAQAQSAAQKSSGQTAAPKSAPQPPSQKSAPQKPQKLAAPNSASKSPAANPSEQ